MATGLLIMGPHADDLDDSLLFQDFVDQSMLYIDAASIGPGKITHEFFNRRGSVERVFPDDFQQLGGLAFETGRGQLLGVLLGLFGIDNLPYHQSSSRAHSSTGVCKPSRMDSRMPGMDRR
jgi:hypothetical protein